MLCSKSNNFTVFSSIMLQKNSCSCYTSAKSRLTLWKKINGKNEKRFISSISYFLVGANRLNELFI
ncbi:hypothetical protein CYV26_09930 [Carnobacterium maltaromaticum]|nr:hypothetical protein CYV26_09930 [Carnobacterium maltaromaticum]